MWTASTLLNKKRGTISPDESEELIKPHQNDQNIDFIAHRRMENPLCQFLVPHKDAH